MPDDAAVAALAACGVVASVQPMFDAAWGGTEGMYARRLGVGRAAAMNPFAALASAGVTLAFGSDAPVTPAEPVGRRPRRRAAPHGRQRAFGAGCVHRTHARRPSRGAPDRPRRSAPSPSARRRTSRSCRRGTWSAPRRTRWCSAGPPTRGRACRCCRTLRRARPCPRTWRPSWTAPWSSTASACSAEPQVRALSVGGGAEPPARRPSAITLARWPPRRWTRPTRAAVRRAASAARPSSAGGPRRTCKPLSGSSPRPPAGWPSTPPSPPPPGGGWRSSASPCSGSRFTGAGGRPAWVSAWSSG